MTPRWGVSHLRHDGGKEWHSYNMSEKGARALFAEMKGAACFELSVVLWCRKSGKRDPQEYMCHKANSRKHSLLSLMA